MEIEVNKNSYCVLSEPQNHIVIPTKKELHGWWPGKRECTSERILINPYNGCGIRCFFCYTLAFPGYFQIFRNKKIVIVAQDFDKIIAEQLDCINVASCGYLSPVTDPFQEINKIYRVSEKIIKEFVKRNIPIEFITKAEIPQDVIPLLKEQRHSFGQVSILTPSDDLRKILVPHGAVTDKLFKNLERLSKEGIWAVCRIDPVLPYITDKRKDLEEIISRAKDCGVRHIVTSCLDISVKIQTDLLEFIKRNFGAGIAWDYRKLYVENIDGYLNANIEYRKSLFDSIRRICDKNNMTFALCMEYETAGKSLHGLNKEFMSSRNCEGIDIPLYRRKGDKFYPIYDCSGDCLFCNDAKCGIEDLAMGKEGSKKDWKLKDYRRWSKLLK